MSPALPSELFFQKCGIRPQRIETSSRCPWRSSRADTLVDLLIATVHRIGATAEKRVESELIADLKRVAGKPALLFKLAAASLAKPDDTVRAVVFPVVDEQTLRDLVAEGEATGPMYRHHLQAVIRGSYRVALPPHAADRARRSDIPLQQPGSPAGA